MDKPIKKKILYDENGISEFYAEKICEITNLFGDGFDAKEPGDKSFFAKDIATLKIKNLGEENSKENYPALKKGNRIKIIIKLV